VVLLILPIRVLLNAAAWFTWQVKQILSPRKLALMTGASRLTGDRGLLAFTAGADLGVDFGADLGVGSGVTFGVGPGCVRLPKKSRKASKALSASATLIGGVRSEGGAAFGCTSFPPS